MTEDALPSAKIDTSVAHPARIYDYWLGGKDNFAADREAGDLVLASRPGLRESVQENRAFLGRVVRLLATEYGIRQFFDIGTGIPSGNNTHTVAQTVAPDAKIVYTDNDRCKSGCTHERLSRALPASALVEVYPDARRGGNRSRTLTEELRTRHNRPPICAFTQHARPSCRTPPDEPHPKWRLGQLLALPPAPRTRARPQAKYHDGNSSQRN